MDVYDPDTGFYERVYPTPELHADLSDLYAEECSHANVEVRRREFANGAIHFMPQCTVCGRGVGSPLARAKVPTDVPIWENDLEGAYKNTRQQSREKILLRHLRQQQAKSSSWWKKYDVYLESDDWAARRQKVLARCNGLCEGCLERPAIDVHHLTYRNVGEEFLFELVGLCRLCHSRWHEVRLGEAEPSN